MKLNLLGLSKAVSGAGVAYMYEEMAAKAVVQATTLDGRISPFDWTLQMLVGWAPFVIASMNPGPFTSSMAGGIAYHRVENLVNALRAQAAQR